MITNKPSRKSPPQTTMPAEAIDHEYSSPPLTEETNLFDKYELGRLLGVGASAKVYHARNLKTNQTVAIKAVSKRKLLLKGHSPQAALIKREIAIMSKLSHPSIVKLLEVLATKSKIFFVMELAKGGELFTKVSKHKFSEDLCRRYFQQLISAVMYCHSNGVYHRDLKLENLLLDENWNLKVSDFGLSAVTGQTRQDGLLHTLCGTPAYIAPEVLAKKGYNGAKVDIWSCGVILYVLNAGYLPFNNTNLACMYRKIYRGEYTCPNWTSPELKRFLSRLLDTNPDARITIEEILHDSWFNQGYNEVKILQDIDHDLGAESKKDMNAFDIISFDLSGLFCDPYRERFVSADTPERILKRVGDVVSSAKEEEERFTVVRMKGWGVKVLGKHGSLVVLVEVFRLTDELVMVEIGNRDKGNEPGYEIWKERFRPKLCDLIYQSDAMKNFVYLPHAHKKFNVYGTSP